MPLFKSVDYGEEGKVTAEAIDRTNGDFLWVAFEQDSLGTCPLKKVSAHDHSVVYFDLDIPVDRINRMVQVGNYVFLAVNDDDYYMYRVHVSNPITGQLGFAHPAGVTENPVDVVLDSGSLWFLTPGDTSGENAKIIETNSVGTHQQTIDLMESGEEILNAKRLTVASGGDIYVVTYTDPVQVWRVYEISAGFWTMTKDEII